MSESDRLTQIIRDIKSAAKRGRRDNAKVECDFILELCDSALFDPAPPSEPPAGDELPEGLKIGERKVEVRESAFGLGWFISDKQTGEQMRHDGGHWLNTSNYTTDRIRYYWPTRTAAIEAACQHADLPEGDDMGPVSNDELCDALSKTLARAEQAERERDELRGVFNHAIDCVDRVFQVESGKPPPILPDYCRLGESKFAAVPRMAEDLVVAQARIATLEAALHDIRDKACIANNTSTRLSESWVRNRCNAALHQKGTP